MIGFALIFFSFLIAIATPQSPRSKRRGRKKGGPEGWLFLIGLVLAGCGV